MTRFLEVERRGRVCIVRMNRPEARNALTDAEQFQEFEDLVREINADLDVRAAILTGNGPSFCAGGNVKKMLADYGPDSGPAARIPAKYSTGIQRIPMALAQLDVPLIAAVNGAAIGAGCDLACMCDIRIAADDARFAESFVKLGIIPGDGGSWFLPRIIGLARTYEMAFTGDTLDAATALQWNLVSSVVPAAQLMDAACQLAERIAVNPPQQVRFAKRLIREGLHQRLEAMLEFSRLYQTLSHRTADHQEGIAALLEKRPPVFHGR
ncbi:crotonase/enoyl-CoA hydratase family protein [Bordetella bronchiseptica]|uniref:crotonase/enoyl-CoA hydratase family protein n=1 Tax=Bordetella bronchiseptica TaxID=518 RepID=UPI00028F95D2|nr:crotonase/enoyl-CoA hydratase family protein [Bordetella bronchiseptica]AUL15588.1 enoyl-CoA hydratase [Bordetella bronchiseptica]AWP58691.1 enoyl-CoA hydratase [Bordetella bronchiseptica]KAK70553.1 enoyl-CoA hydratase/isomerase family protein [Bordetella bronchiseptica CA90 BB02]KAK71140.1 enoyl-CoA hydratase/isomerase family protein [Bordetella bronchiseptica MO211]KDC30277.1 enoyl-CoA hydratase/isomerase family protein [Bordetella bronchiseptica F4563]